MRSLYRFFVKYHVFFLFLILEILSLFFVFSYNNYHKSRFLNSSNRISGSVYQTFNSAINYFRLSKINEELALENIQLRNQLTFINQIDHNNTIPYIEDSNQVYSFTSAKVINNNVYNQHNFITLNKGSKQGIKKDQGIITANGVVGIVTNVSKSYSTGISLLNTDFSLSAKIKKNNYYGPLSWDGLNYQFVNLQDIPFHVEIEKGDTIVTSGFSSYFPEGITIGTIDSFERIEGDNFYAINVKLSVDFRSILFVEVIENLRIREIDSLEYLNQVNEDLD